MTGVWPVAAVPWAAHVELVSDLKTIVFKIPYELLPAIEEQSSACNSVIISVAMELLASEKCTERSGAVACRHSTTRLMNLPRGFKDTLSGWVHCFATSAIHSSFKTDSDAAAAFAPKALADGKRANAQIAAHGLHRDTFLGNLLVQMYGKCGSLEDARWAFGNIRKKNVFSYSLMITAYVQNGHYSQAMEVFHSMDTNVIPDDITFIGILGASSKLGCLAEARAIHGAIDARELKPSLFVQNALIRMYDNCGSLDDARTVFERMPRRNIISWNAMVAAYARRGYTQRSLRLLREMDLQGEPANVFTFASILGSCSSPRLLAEGRAIHARIVRIGLESHVLIGTALLSMYAKCGSLNDARSMFDGMTWENVVSWNAMFAAYAQSGHFAEVLELYGRMDVEADVFTFASVLAASASMRALAQGKAIHARIRGSKYMSDAVVQNALLNLYAKCGELEEAKRVFDEFCSRDVVAWNALIAAYAQHGYNEEALRLYEQMDSKGVQADAFTFATTLGTCATLGAIAEGKLIHGCIVTCGFELDDVVQKALLNMYAKCGSLEDARIAFDSMKSKDVISWTAMIVGYSHHGRGIQALEMFRQLNLEGLNPDDITYASILHACSHEGLLGEGRQYLISMKDDYNITHTVEHYHCLIDLLGRMGRLHEAEELINSMPFECEGDIVAWTSLLSACRMHNNAEQAARITECVAELIATGAAPYVLVSNIYATKAVISETK